MVYLGAFFITTWLELIGTAVGTWKWARSSLFSSYRKAIRRVVWRPGIASLTRLRSVLRLCSWAYLGKVLTGLEQGEHKKMLMRAHEMNKALSIMA